MSRVLLCLKTKWNRINTVLFFGVSRNKTFLVDSGQDNVVLAQAFKSSRFPLEQGESFSDLSCLTCARRVVRLASSVSNNIEQAPAMGKLGMWKVQILSWLPQNMNLERQVQKDKKGGRPVTHNNSLKEVKHISNHRHLALF